MSSSDDSSGQGQLSSTVLIAVRMVQTSIGLAGAPQYEAYCRSPCFRILSMKASFARCIDFIGGFIMKYCCNIGAAIKLGMSVL
jgi:hypothetical protein